MKKLESLKSKSFKSLENFKFENLKSVRGGGEVTAGGQRDYGNGTVVAWDYDTITSGGNLNYHNLHYL